MSGAITMHGGNRHGRGTHPIQVAARKIWDEHNLDRFVAQPPRGKRASIDPNAAHMCDCGNVALPKKKGNAWVCQRCDDIEKRQRFEREG